MLPREIEQIILSYKRDLEKFDKLENLFFQFLKHFRILYKPLVDGIWRNPLAHAPDEYPIWPHAHIRFRRAQERFNHFAHKLRRMGANPEYWLRRAFELIDWGGTAIVFWNQGPVQSFQFMHMFHPTQRALFSELHRPRRPYADLSVLDFNTTFPTDP